MNSKFYLKLFKLISDTYFKKSFTILYAFRPFILKNIQFIEKYRKKTTKYIKVCIPIFDRYLYSTGTYIRQVKVNLMEQAIYRPKCLVPRQRFCRTGATEPLAIQYKTQIQYHVTFPVLTITIGSLRPTINRVEHIPVSLIG